MWNRKKLHLNRSVFTSGIIIVFVAIFSGISPVSADSAEMYYSMGQEYMEKGDFDMAVIAFEKTVELSPNSPEAHNALGEAYVKLLRFEDAAAEFDNALELKQDYSQAERNRRRTAIAVERYEPVKGSRLKRWHKVAILGGITAVIALVSALIVQSAS